MKLPLNFESRLTHYKAEIANAESEASRAYLFLEFIRGTFGTINAGYAAQLLPILEHYVQHKEATVYIRGRIDVLLNNLIIEFKRKLDQINLEEAQEKLQRYIVALYAQGQHDYLALISNGEQFVVYHPLVSQDRPVIPEQVRLHEVDTLNIHQVLARDLYLWLDRYLLQETLREPSTESFVRELGISYFNTYVLAHILDLWNQHKGKYQGLYREWANYLSIVYGTSVESEKLFFRHTYLATIAKLIVSQLFYPSGSQNLAFLQELFSGKAFTEWGIGNFLEEDFFSWIGRHSEGLDIVRALAKQLSRFDMTRMDEDVLKGVYQDLVDPEERHDLGEYYTPEWIAQYIVRHVLQDNPYKKVLDPACGSGTFLSTAIRHKIENVALGGDQLLRHIITNVVGIDIHPLAVIIAKTNYLVALRSLLKTRSGPFSLPVYLSDSLRPQALETEIGGVRAYRKIIDRDFSLYLPALEDPSAIDNIVDAIKKYALQWAQDPENGSLSFSNFLETRQLRSGDISILERTAQTLATLISEPQRGDTIWAFVLKNFYKPAFLLHSFDAVIGNPPWLSYRYVDNPDYQQNLKQLIVDHYALTSRPELITHMELATLFFLASAENYLVEDGEIGFVMPRAIFTADQHDVLRRGTYRHVYLTLFQIDDLKQVEPIFKERGGGTVPACLVFAKKGGKTTYPVTGHILKGKLSGRNASLELCGNELSFTKTSFSLDTIGKRSFIAPSTPSTSLPKGRSHYYPKFKQGATIVPRQFWFVDILIHPDLGLDPGKPFLRSSARAMERAKKGYFGARAEGNVEAAFLYGTLTGSELLPFAHFPVLPVVLPIRIEKESYVLCERRWVQQRGFQGLEAWLEKVEQLWRRHREAKADQISLYAWLDYRHKLTGQDSKAPYRVLYSTSGSHLVACVVDCTELRVTVHTISIPLAGFVAESKSYQYETNDRNEANYLSAVLNSRYIDTLIKPLQSRGLWGPRDFHKKPLELPIPRYNATISQHQRLAELGEKCSSKAQEAVYNGSLPEKTAFARQHVRGILQTELQEIDGLVAKMLSI